MNHLSNLDTLSAVTQVKFLLLYYEYLQTAGCRQSKPGEAVSGNSQSPPLRWILGLISQQHFKLPLSDGLVSNDLCKLPAELI